jgi:D-3-phosphoglycerate dehydrogenase
MPKVAVIGRLFDDTSAEAQKLRDAGAQIQTGQGRTEEEVVAACADAEVVMCFGLSTFNDRVFAALPKLKFLQQCTVGYDWVDVPAATRHGVVVANSPFFCIQEVSDHAAMLILACIRRLPQQLSVEGWDRQAAVERMDETHRSRGQTIGFVAFGKIARLTAEKLSGFGFRYVAFDPFLKQEQVEPWHVKLVSLEELCRQSDVVSMHALLNDSTRHMFGEAQFRAMKKSAAFVNTSRGGCVDEAAMTRALKERWINCAGLDVLETEPPDPGHPILTLPNAIVLPHTAGYSYDAMVDNRQQTVDQVVRVLNGEWPTVCVNPDVRASARLQPAVRA